MVKVIEPYSHPAERGHADPGPARAVGIWGAVFGISLALGPVVGGLLVSDVSWRAIFWINIPIGAAAIILTQLFVPESRAGTARRFDPWGQLLVITLLATLTYGVIEGRSAGWGSPLIVAMFAGAVAAAVGLVQVESRRRQPLLETRFFRSVPFSGASLIAVLAFGVLGGFLFLNTLYLQDSRGYSALHAGLLTLPMAVLIFIFAPVSGRLVGSRGPRLPLVLAGLAIMAAALLLLPLSDSTPGALAAGHLRGLRARVRAGQRPDLQRRGVRDAGASNAGLATASHAAWAVLAACGLGIVALGWASTGPRAVATAQRVREMLAAETPGTASLDRKGDPHDAAFDGS
jgi:MFS family permease